MNRSTLALRGFQFCVLAGLCAAGLGCSPSLLWFMNRGDDKSPAKYPLDAKGKREIVVAVVATANPAITCFPEFSGIDRDLAQKMGQVLVDETVKDKLRVTVVDQAKVQALRQKNTTEWDIANRSKLAKDLGADYLIEVDITHFSIYSQETGKEVCKGKATASVKVYDAAGNGSATMEYPHTCTPPLRSTGDMSPQHYRQFLVKSLAKELAQEHVRHTPDRDLPQSH